MICRHGIQIWSGDPPSCAFTEDGKFISDNWSCRLMARLRALCDNWSDKSPFPYVYSEDQNIGVISFGGNFAILSWYKSRGRTDAFWITDGHEIRPGTEQDAYDIIAFNLEETKKVMDDTTEEWLKKFPESADEFKYPQKKEIEYL